MKYSTAGPAYCTIKCSSRAVFQHHGDRCNSCDQPLCPQGRVGASLRATFETCNTQALSHSAITRPLSF